MEKHRSDHPIPSTLLRKEQQRQAWITALRLLAASPKSPAEIRKKLIQKGYPHAVVEGTLTALAEQSILSDRAFALELVNKYRHVVPSGRRKVAFELKRRGISATIRHEILNSLTETEEREKARELARQRWQRLAQVPLSKRKKRVYDFLIRRGFDFQIARELVQEFDADLSHEN